MGSRLSAQRCSKASIHIQKLKLSGYKKIWTKL